MRVLKLPMRWPLVPAVLVMTCSCGTWPKTVPPVEERLMPPRSPGQERQRPGEQAPRRLPPKREYVGLTRRDAALKAWAAGQSYRVVEVDGQPTGGGGPRQPDRLNFTIRNEVVVKVTEG